MRPFRISMTLVVALISSMVIALPAPAVTTSAAGPAGAAFTSDNVQWLSVNPRHIGSAGGRLVGNYFYVTDPRGIYIYDVSDPSSPVLTASLPIVQGGTGNPTFTALAQEDPETNGKILLVEGVDPNAPANGARLLVVDVANKAAPTVVGSIAKAEHTWTCVADCAFAYGRSGTIVDLRDPANPKEAGNWKVGVPGSASAYTHDITEVAPGRAMTAGQPSFYLDVTDPTKPKRLATIKTEFHTLGYHGAAWPQKGKDPFLLMGTELPPKLASSSTNPAGSDCTGDGEIATYDTGEILAAERYVAENPDEPFPVANFKKVDAWRIAGSGTWADGRAPFHTFLYCAHWFDPHPQFNGGGLVSASHYDWGTRFLSVDPAGKISEVGWFQPVGGLQGASYWISEDIVYTLDYRRGMDILRFAGSIGAPPAPDTGLPSERVYFSCGSKVANADGAPNISWDTTAPTTSATGGGCGAVDSQYTHTNVPNIHDVTFSGTFRGNLNSLTVEAHNLYAGAGRAAKPTSVTVRLLVDGADLTPGASGFGRPVTMNPVPSASGAAEMFRFSITNIGFTAPADSGEHRVQLLLNGGTRRMTTPYRTNDAANVWVYDATEVPSGITFNPSSLEPTWIRAKRPAA